MSEPSKKIKGDYLNNAILSFISRAFITNLFLKPVSYLANADIYCTYN